MSKPLIGLVPSSWDGENRRYVMGSTYMHWVARMGGMPVMLHYTDDPEYMEEIVPRLDGVLFTGGPDLSSVYYGEEPTPAQGGIVPQRDAMEKALFECAVIRHKKPTLGICKGMQLLNVFFGGDLYQDIAQQYPGKHMLHRQGSKGNVATHTAAVIPGSPLHNVTGKDEIKINTFHHQAVRKLADGLEVMATAPDGIIEAYWKPDYPFLWATQFHPEMFDEDFELSRQIFKTFIDACKK